jgi:hypothetical protein
MTLCSCGWRCRPDLYSAEVRFSFNVDHAKKNVKAILERLAHRPHRKDLERS